MSALALISCNNNEPQATIEGKVTETTGKMLYLDALGVDKVTVADSVKLKEDGTFRFHVPCPECYDFYRLRIERELINLSIDFTETIQVSATYPTMSIAYQVEGSDDNLRLKDLVLKQIELQNAVKAAMPCQRVGVAVLGMEVPHAHIHLVPLQKESDLLFTNPKKQLTPEQFIAIAEKIKANL